MNDADTSSVPPPSATPTDVPPPRLVFWETTAGCNLECVHCRRLEISRELMLNDLPTGFALGMIDQIAEVGRPILVFSGGEPLMRPDIFDLATHARQRGLLIALATNGTMIDSALAARIAAAGFDRVSVSLDGADAATHDRWRGLPGSFNLSMHALRALHAAGVPTQLNCTIARHNQHQLRQVAELGRQMGVVAVHYFLLVPVGCGEQIAGHQMLDAAEVEQRLHELYAIEQETQLQIKATCAPHYYRIVRQERQRERAAGGHPGPAGGGLSAVPDSDARGAAHEDRRHTGPPGEAQAQGRSGSGRGQEHRSGGHARGQGHPGGPAALHAMTRGCLAGTAVCFISHDGKVFPCGYLPAEAGDLRRQGFAEIWRNSPVFADLRDPTRLGGKCGACAYRFVCSGCRARAFYQYGDYLAEEPYCEYDPAG